MSDAAISVQRLRLVAPRGAPLRTLQARVEDALRTSSKPALLAHRFVLVRRLRLTLPREASAQTLALRLEDEWRRIEAAARPIESADDDAAAVWAADEVQARLHLLERWLRAAPAAAWFWQRLLPAVSPTAPLPARVAALLAAPLAEDWPAPIERVLRQRLLDAAWPRLDAAALAAAVFDLLAPPLRAAVPWVRSAVHTITAPAAAARGHAGSAPAPPAPAEAASTPAGATMQTPPRDARAALLRAKLVENRAAAPPSPRPLGSDDNRREHVPVAADSTGTAPAAARQTAPPDVTPAAVSASTAALYAAPLVSAWAGLWLLLPLLRRAGFEQEAQPLPLLAALLRHAAARCDFDAAPRAWIESVAALATEAAATTMAPQAAAWWRRARIACVRDARLPLKRLLRRPGRVLLAPHRVDVEFALAQADIRIRRAGFDLDPGYLPWLDCIVRLHYR